MGVAYFWAAQTPITLRGAPGESVTVGSTTFIILYWLLAPNG